MGFIGDAIGRIISRNQQETQEVKGQNAEDRAASEAAKDAAAEALGDAAGSIFVNDGSNSNILGELGENVGEAWDAAGDWFGAAVDDAWTDVSTKVEDGFATVKNTLDALDEAGGAVLEIGTAGIKNVWNTVTGAFNEGAEKKAGEIE